MSLRNQAIQGVSWTIVQQFGVAIVSFIVHALIARMTTPEELGTYGLLVVFVALGNSISDSGMGQSIIRSDDLDDRDYGTIFLSNFGISDVTPIN